MLYYAVTIENLKTKETYDVIVETKVRVNEKFESLSKRVAILNAIDEIAHNLTEGGKGQFIRASEHIYEKSNGYDNFVKSLKSDLKIKVKVKKI